MSILSDPGKIITKPLITNPEQLCTHTKLVVFNIFTHVTIFHFNYNTLHQTPVCTLYMYLKWVNIIDM